MDPSTVDIQAIRESMRRRAVGTTNNAGIPGTSPINTNNMQPPQMPQPPMGGASPENPSAGAIGALGKQQPGEAQLIVKALDARLKKLGEMGQ